MRWKLDGDDVAGDKSALIRTFLIIDGTSETDSKVIFMGHEIVKLL